MFDPLCGQSFQKGAKFIAICDLVICVLFVLAHFVGGGYVYEKKYEKYQKDVANTLNSTETSSDASNFIENVNQSGIGTLPQSQYTITMEDYTKLVSESLPSVDIFVIIGLFVILFAIAHICTEIWLCRLLLKAAAHKDGSACKTWFWCRLAVTIIFCLYTIIGLISVQTDILDWVFLFVNFYRIYSLLVIYAFKKEISASVSMVKPR